MQIVTCSADGFIKGLKLQALNEANFIFISALVGLENPEELHQEPQFFLKHFCFLKSNFRAVGFCQPCCDQHHHDEGKWSTTSWDHLRDFCLKLPKALPCHWISPHSSLFPGMKCTLSGGWMTAPWNHYGWKRPSRSSKWSEILQGKVTSFIKALVSPKTHTKVPSAALGHWFFSVNTTGNATFGVSASLCSCLKLYSCQKIILSVFFRVLEWFKLEKPSDQWVQPLTQHVFVDMVLILRKKISGI